MGNVNNIRTILGSLKYKSAPSTDLSFKLPLNQTFKQNVEFDRNANLDLIQVYDDERQKSTIFRPTAKFNMFFKNTYVGKTNYVPFENNLYYINAAEAASLQCSIGANNVSWTGIPQFNEFDFIRTDSDVVGYTQPPNNHLLFVPQSANTYNWNFYLSYPYSRDKTKQLQAYDQTTNTSFSWTVSDGIPFVIQKIQVNGRNYISFRCPVKHGLNPYEYVKLSFSYDGQSIFQVDTFGLETYGSDGVVFNIIDIGYTGSTFSNGTTGTFKRVILESNTADTTSIYYIRKNKILTNPEDITLIKTGFENNIYGISKKYESSGYTPNGIARVSIKEGSQAYTLTFNKDIDIDGLYDNLGRPITTLFFTAIWKGYFGWTTGSLKQGYDFNLPLNPFTNNPNPWWDNSNTNSNTTFTTNTWTNGPNTFNYVNTPREDDIIDGDYCEWNYFEQKERVISEIQHKFKFNSQYFDLLPSPIPTPPTNPLGYYYKPFYPLTIKVYSDYIEDANPKSVVDVPNYAYFSKTLNKFIWRDIFPYGFIDTVTNFGVNYPFLNAGHYPFGNYIFRLISEGTNYTEYTIIEQPTTDECE